MAVSVPPVSFNFALASSIFSAKPISTKRYRIS
nr:MAG TPA: hypothetical protein [Caudoviricetes sp.]